MKLLKSASALALSTVLGAGLAVTLTPTGATAAAADGTQVKLAKHAAATTKAEQRQVKEYWTPWRMKNAIPAGVKIDSQAGKKPAPNATPQPAQPRFGKVFFTLGGANYVCSGTATNSSNGDVVTTAGHCLNEGPGAFATNFAFVPAYNNGAAPYGTWTAQHLYTTSGWANSGDFNVDVGFAVMNENASGQSLTGVVGGYPIAFNLARGLTYTAYGYPAASPFNGQTLYSCTGTAIQDTYGGSQDQGIPCDMTGGSSGGGWITGGSLNSVNSFGYTGVRNVMWGPYFGPTIASVYNAAAVG